MMDDMRADQDGQGSTELAPIQKVAPVALATIERAHLEMLIEMSHRYPRTITAFRAAVRSMATVDAETASSCFYTLPARKSQDGKKNEPIQGPSIRFMEFARLAFGGIDCSSEIVGDDGRWISARAVVFDAQTGNRESQTVRRRITTKTGSRYSEDMIQVTGMAAMALARRNALRAIIPWALIKPVLDECKKMAAGDEKTLTDRRAAAVASCAKAGVNVARLCAALDVAGVDDIDVNALISLRGIWTAIQDGDSTVEEAFPDPAVKAAEDAAQPASVAPSAAPANTLNPDAAAKRVKIRDLKLKASPDKWAAALAASGLTAIQIGGCNDLPTLDLIIDTLSGDGAKGGAA